MGILHTDTRLLLKDICSMLASKERHYLVYFWFMVNEKKNAMTEGGAMVLTIQC